jgi:hypothetical protein
MSTIRPITTATQLHTAAVPAGGVNTPALRTLVVILVGLLI